MRVDRNTTFREIFQFPAFSALVPYLIGNCEIPDPDWTLEEMQKHYEDCLHAGDSISTGSWPGAAMALAPGIWKRLTSGLPTRCGSGRSRRGFLRNKGARRL